MNHKENPISFQKEISFHYEESQILLRIINVLPQPRTTFEKIDELALDIADKGLISPLLIARFDKENCQKHLDFIKDIYQKDIKIENLTASEIDNKYYILIAGERRIRAIGYLIKNGFDLEKTFPGNKIDVRILDNPNPDQFMSRQFSENIHQRPEPEQEAPIYRNYFEYRRKKDPNYNLSLYARHVGKDRETIKRAIQFCLLPQFVRKAVEQKPKGMAYGVACEIGRMAENGFNEDEISFMAAIAMMKKWNVAKCHEEVTKKIREAESQQEALMIFTEEDRKKMERESLKKGSALEIKKGILDFLHYFGKVNFLIKEGKIDSVSSPFQEKELLEYYLNLIYKQEELIPHLNLIKEEKERVKKVLKDSKKIVKENLIFQSND